MIEVYGGLRLESLVLEDPYFQLQMELHETGLIEGIQLRIAHPAYTPEVTPGRLLETLCKLPSSLKVFIHYGAENVGVDIGECFDETGAYAEKGTAAELSWSEWNCQTLLWGFWAGAALGHPPGFPWGVAHAGYRLDESERAYSAEREMVERWQEWAQPHLVALENVPLVCDRDLYARSFGRSEVRWPRERYIGVGGTPDSMRRFLQHLGPGWRCLIDFTRLRLTVNQANCQEFGNRPDLEACRDVEKVVEGYLALPHWPICHFSGMPSRECLIDAYDFPLGPAAEPVRSAIRQMQAVCLEVAWRPDRPDTAVKTLEEFRNLYVS